MIFFLVFLLILSAFFSAAETAFTSLSMVQIKSIENENTVFSKKVVKLMHHRDYLVATILVGNNIANIGSSALTSILAMKLGGDIMVGYATGILTLVIIIFAEITPKQLALRYNKEFSKALSIFIAPLLTILYPIVFFVSLFGRAISLLFGTKVSKESGLDGLFHMVAIAEEHGEVDAYEKSVVQNVFKLGDNVVMSIITHRRNIFSLSSNLTAEEALDKAMKAGYSRIPVYLENAENIVGIVMLRDIFSHKINNMENKKLSSFMLEPLVVPASMKLDELLKVFAKQPLNLAVALDEYGGLAGIVSREDLFEVVLGDLYDENEEAEIKTTLLDDGSWRIQGDTPLYWFEEVYPYLDEEKDITAHTVGGYIVEKLGRLPVEHEVVDLISGYVQIEKVGDNRILELIYVPKLSYMDI